LLGVREREMGTRIAKRDLEAMRQIEAMTDEELDAEIRSYGLDPDKLAKHAFNRVCEALRQKSIECGFSEHQGRSTGAAHRRTGEGAEGSNGLRCLRRRKDSMGASLLQLLR